MSRLRINPPTVYDVLCEVAAPSSGNEAFVLWKYPDDYNDPAVLKAIAQFTFPLGDTAASTRSSDSGVELFTFVLTDADGRYTFGYVRQAPNSPTALCLCTALPWPNLFHALLNHIAAVNNNDTESAVQSLLCASYHHAVPCAGGHLHIESSVGKNKLDVVCPDHTRLPTIQSNVEMGELYNSVSFEQLAAIYASLLRERRVVFTGARLSQCSSCVQAIVHFLHPMHWQHIFIPCLPAHLTSYLTAPMPFIIGVPKTTWMRARAECDLTDVVVIDLDEKQFDSPFNDYADLPLEIRQLLTKELARTNHMLGDGFVRSFVRATCALIGPYRLGLRSVNGRLTFDAETFVAASRASLRPCLRLMTETQILQQFLDERVEALNRGHVIDDDFEREASLFEHRKPRTSDKFREAGRGVVQKMSKMTAPASLMPKLAGHSSSTPNLQSARDKMRSLRVNGNNARPSSVNDASIAHQQLNEMLSSPDTPPEQGVDLALPSTSLPPSPPPPIVADVPNLIDLGDSFSTSHDVIFDPLLVGRPTKDGPGKVPDLSNISLTNSPQTGTSVSTTTLPDRHTALKSTTTVDWVKFE